MSYINTNLKLALALTLTLLGPGACNTQKAETVEEDEATEAQSEATPNRDNRNGQSGDAAFIKIFPDGDVIPTRGESTTVNAPAPTATTSAPAAESVTTAPTETQAPAPAATLEETVTTAPSQPAATTPVEESQAPAPVAETQPAAEPAVSEPAPAPAPVVIAEPAPAPAPIVIAEPAPAPAPIVIAEPAPAPAPVVINEPAPAPAPAAPAPIEEPSILKDADDTTRPVLALNESTASQIISVLPKENKSIVAIGKHSEFVPGPYMILAKWSNDSKKVKVNVTSEEAKEKNCAIDDKAQGEWKTLGVFYLTKNAKVVITNSKNSHYAVKNELLLKPVIAENVTTPSKFKCLDGQIDGQGLVGFP